MTSTQTGPASTIQGAKKLFGSAARLAQKQAELAALNTVTLPKLYYAVGKHLMSVEKLPPELEQKRAEIRHLEAQNSVEDVAGAHSSVEPSSESFASKAASLTQKAARKAAKVTGDAARTARIQAGYVAMGKAAAEKYGERAMPASLAEDYRKSQSQRATLAAEIEELQTSAMRGLSLRGVRWAAIAASVVFLAALTTWQLVVMRKPRPLAPAAVSGHGPSVAHGNTARQAAEKPGAAGPDDQARGAAVGQRTAVVSRVGRGPQLRHIPSLDAAVFSDEQWSEICFRLDREFGVMTPASAAEYFDFFAQLKQVCVEHDAPNPSTKLLFSLSKALYLPLGKVDPKSLTKSFKDMLRAAYDTGIGVLNEKSFRALER